MIFRPASFSRPTPEVINPLSEEALGSKSGRHLFGSSASQTWVANLAVFVPFGISQPFLVREIFWGTGSGVASNIDVGLYDTAGNRLASLGTTASGAASAVTTSTTWTDYTLAPGDYFMAFACSGSTNAIHGFAPTANLVAALGVGQMTTAFVLPNPATIVPLTNALVPYFGLNGNTVTV